MKKGRQLNPAFVKAHQRPPGQRDGGIDVKVSSGVSAAILKQARKSGQLNLSNRMLTSVPDGVWKINSEPGFDHTSVDISKSSDEQWWDQVDLTKLILASNQLKELSEDIQCLPALALLDVHSNELVSLPHNIGQLHNLTRLVLSHNNLEELVPEVWSLPCLQCLKLDYNQFTMFPEDMGQLRTLEELDVGHNKLVSLPQSVGDLSKLLHFNASNNALKELPDSIGRLHELRDLKLNNNELSRLPKLGPMQHLTILNACQNKLSELPIVEVSQSLKELLLGDNKIRRLDTKVLLSYHALMVLNLRGNSLTEIPEDIASMDTLERLDLSNNDLMGLPPKLGTMNLKSVQLDGNPLKTIRLAIIQKGTFEILKYLRGRIVDTPQDVEVVVKHEKRAASSSVPNQQSKTPGRPPEQGNPLAGPEMDFPLDAKSVTLTKCGLTQVPPRVFELARVTELNLSGNKLTTIPPDIGGLKQLTSLDLRTNQLSSLPEELSSCTQLRVVILEFNQFTSLPPVLYHLVNLETILAASNRLASIDADGLKMLPKLSTLDLGNNSIGEVPPKLGLLENLRYLNLGGNVFRNPRPAVLAKGTPALLQYLKDRIPQ